MNTQSFTTPFSKQIIRRKEVEAITGLSRSSIYREIAANRFPKPIKLTPSGTSVGWLMADINGWIEQRIKDSRAA